MEEFLSITVLGLSTAAIFALAASGLVLTYTTTGIFNFAHGAIGDARARSRYWQLHVDWGWPIPLALATVVLVLAPGARRADRARDHAWARRRSRDDPDHHHGEPARRRSSGVGQWIWPPQEVYRVPLLFPGETAEPLRRERHVPRPVHLPRRRRSSPSACGCCCTARRSASTCAPASTAGRWRCCTAPGRIARPPPPGPSGAAWPRWPGVLVGPLSGQLSHTNLTLLIINAYAAAHDRSAAQPADDLRRARCSSAWPTPTRSGTSPTATPTSSRSGS